MKKTSDVATIILLMSISALAEASEHCPRVRDIERIDANTYRSKADAGEWIGTAERSKYSENEKMIFIGALAIQGDTDVQKLQRCTYGVKPEGIVDMRLILEQSKNFTIKTETDFWVNESGPFGLIYMVCENVSPENCKFSIVE